MTGTLDKREAKDIRISFLCLSGPEAFSDASRKRKGKDQTLTSLGVTLRHLIVFPFSHVLEKKKCVQNAKLASFTENSWVIPSAQTICSRVLLSDMP